jgi:hypothetical protein
MRTLPAPARLNEGALEWTGGMRGEHTRPCARLVTAANRLFLSI